MASQPRRASLQPMNIEADNSSTAAPFADSEDGCRRLPWYCSYCSNKRALVAIIGLVFFVALVASLVLPHDSSENAHHARADASLFVLSNSVTFVTIGDWGQHGEEIQRATAVTLGTWATLVNASFVVSVGDNFYMKGVENEADPQFDESWRLVYAAPGPQRPWFSVFGNHDFMGNLTAQEVYSRDARWHAFRNRSLSWTLPGSEYHCVGLVFIDTTPLVPAYAKSDNVVMIGNLNMSSSPTEQLNWLDSVLLSTASRCRAVFTVGHHPGISPGSDGDQPGIRDHVFPLLRRHAVDAYLSGHDHLLALLQLNETIQVVSGGGSNVQDGHRTPETLWFKATPGFSLHSVNSTHAAHTFIGGISGDPLYSAIYRLLQKAS